MDMAVLPEPTQRVFLWRWVWLALTLACLIGAVVGYLLWGTTIADHRNAFDTGWKSSAAVLAVLATFITVDRLRLSQREHHRQLIVAHLTQRDLVARQITELSAKASEQLGSDKAAVRIGGLTDLERLAQSHPELRQTVADRLCAYLRAPFDPPDTSASDDEATRRLELDVRRTAQRILARHLRWPADAPEQPATFWENINLDLRDATLVDLDLNQCRVGDADFYNARLHGRILFSKATFTTAIFIGATFSDDAEFSEATVTRYANFIKATFTGTANFIKATLANAAFMDTIFSGFALFAEATFTENASFSNATVAEGGHFEMATFTGSAWFLNVAFAENADFAGATFAGETSFNRVTFTGQAWFGEAINLRGAGVDLETARQAAHAVALSSNVDHVPAARFDGTLSMESARVIDSQRDHSWPPAWRAKPNRDDPDGPHLLFPQKMRKIMAEP